jgi:hypothetical protein
MDPNGARPFWGYWPRTGEAKGSGEKAPLSEKERERLKRRIEKLIHNEYPAHKKNALSQHPEGQETDCPKKALD